ncbi:MAG: sporulation protein YjcZ [Mollicutes bacterium]|jgi:hypothetical protein|nr:sporulation protein YjcZ [Mollicutes bacterium]
MYSYGGYPGGSCCFNPCCGFGYGGHGCGAAIILVLFILLVIVLGSRAIVH